MSRPPLVVATSNPSKAGHVAGVAALHGWQVVSAAELGVVLEVPETGATLEENAALKVTAYRAQLPDALLLADDTGVEIDALGGEPGIYVRRWRDHVHDMSDQEIIDYCLTRMRGVPPEERGMQFRSIMAVGVPGAPVRTFAGILRGEVAETIRGPLHAGMPFHAIMFVPQWQVMLGDIAEVDPALRPDKRVHREIATERALAWLSAQYPRS